MDFSELLVSTELLANWPGWMLWLAEPANWLIVLKVALGLGFIIFVHELGHFAVAKWCGVKCEKFYVGFDVPIKLGWGKWGIRLPSSLWKKKWGETEYGIGILPLGGYVKMLGQDDNPARAAEAVRQARMKAEVAAEQTAAGTNSASNAMTSEGGAIASATATATEEEYVLDPRSYMAKSVPQRMAIISAGVVMNVIFAVVFATIAYGIGVPVAPPVVGPVVAGQGAWKADFQIGDRILTIDGTPIEKFSKLQSTVTSLTKKDIADGVEVKIERDGEEMTLTVRPESTRSIVMLGIIGPRTTTLYGEEPTRKHTPAEKAGFKARDQIVQINSAEISNPHDLAAALAKFQDVELDVKVLRGTDAAKGSSKSDEVELHVDVRPRKWIGARMKFGAITAVQDGSPAQKAGVQEGDAIVSIDGRPVDEFDPLTWPDDSRRMAVTKPGEKTTIVVQRGEKTETLEVTPREPTTYNYPGSGLNLNVLACNLALGITYEVEPIVTGVAEKSAAEGKLKVGDEVLKVQIVPADEALKEEEIKQPGDYGMGKRLIDFSDEKRKPSWPWLAERMMLSLSGTELKLTVRRGDATEDVTVPIVDHPNYFHVDRGWQLDAWEEIEKANDVGQAVSKGLHETGFALTAVVRFLRKIMNDPAAGENLGSVLTIGGAAGAAAQQGWAELLIFMTLISANLAVINFLPIPVLDGGHMVFLAYEGIRGKPADERVFGILTMIGFVLLLTLMVFVFWLDIQRYLLPN
jgi:regulator of sigma E protease